MISRPEQITRFYADRTRALRAAVAANVHTTDYVVIDDACQDAWLTLLRRADIDLDDRGASWLTTVAIREAWRFARAPRQVPVGTFRGADCEAGELPEPLAADGDPLTLAIASEEHQRRVRQLRKLKPLERRDLFLLALGYTYVEVSEATSQTVARVNRHVASGRATLRRFGAISDRRAA